MVKLSNKMREKHCPYIVRIIDCFRTESNIYMILEFCGEGDLEKYIGDKGELPEKEALHILYEVSLVHTQICMSLEFLYENGVTHRDLKPENVFMKMEILNGEKQTVFKLGDFGFARRRYRRLWGPNPTWRRSSSPATSTTRAWTCGRWA